MCFADKLYSVGGKDEAFSENGQQLGRLLRQTPLAPPTLSLSLHHPSSVFLLEMGRDWSWSDCFLQKFEFPSSSFVFLPLIPFLVTYPTAYPSLAQISLHFMSFRSRNPQQILPDSFPYQTSVIQSCFLPELSRKTRIKPHLHVAGLASSETQNGKARLLISKQICYIPGLTLFKAALKQFSDWSHGSPSATVTWIKQAINNNTFNLLQVVSEYKTL